MQYLLQRWPGFQGLERAQLRSIEKILLRCRNESRATRVATQFREVARGITIGAEECQIFTPELDLLTRQIQFCDESKQRVRAEIVEGVGRHPVGQKLMTTSARFDKEVVIAAHLERIEQQRSQAA